MSQKERRADALAHGQPSGGDGLPRARGLLPFGGPQNGVTSNGRVAVGQQAHVLGPGAHQERQRHQQGDHHDAEHEPRYAPVGRVDERLNGDGVEHGAEAGPHRRDAHHPAPLTHEPLGQDVHGQGEAAGDLRNAAGHAEEEVELPQAVDVTQRHEGAAEKHGGEEHQAHRAGPRVLHGPDDRREGARHDHLDRQRAVEGGTRPLEVLRHRPDEDARAPDAYARRKRPGDDGDAQNDPAVVDLEGSRRTFPLRS